MSDAERPKIDMSSRLPRHIAIIMDGNGRWAQRRGLPRFEGHRQGAETVRRITEHCCRLGIEQLTLYCFSSENWSRPPEEIEFLMDLLRLFLKEQRPILIENNLRFSVIGRREDLPDDVLAQIDETVAICSGHQGMRLCLALNYGGRDELVDAARRIAAEVQAEKLTIDQIDHAAISERLYTSGMPDPDLLIRTAGEMRVSNFLLWQISYAEIWVTETCWPDFDPSLLDEALSDYAGRTRRFGGLPDADEES